MDWLFQRHCDGLAVSVKGVADVESQLGNEKTERQQWEIFTRYFQPPKIKAIIKNSKYMLELGPEDHLRALYDQKKMFLL